MKIKFCSSQEELHNDFNSTSKSEIPAHEQKDNVSSALNGNSMPVPLKETGKQEQYDVINFADSYDIATYFSKSKSMTREELIDLYRNVYRPPLYNTLFLRLRSEK